ncbi:MAG: protein-disulfide reductase DsbD domain-containing protein [Phycisphaerales bacterium]
MKGLARSLVMLPAAMLGAVFGAEPARPASGDDKVKARLVTEHTALVPGREACIGITFTIAPKWHIYWHGLNDTGGGVEVALTLPEGYEAGKVQWPAPKRYVSPGDILDHVYEDHVTLLVPVKVPADALPGSTAKIAAELGWMVCSDICMIGGESVLLSVPVGAALAEGQLAKAGADAGLFAEARARLPRPIPKDLPPVRIDWTDGSARIHVPGAERLAFYPAAEFMGFESILRDGQAKGDTLTLKLNPYTDGPVRLVGVLEATRPKPGPPSIFSVNTSPNGSPGNPGGG